jgi:hypothetical protein
MIGLIPSPIPNISPDIRGSEIIYEQLAVHVDIPLWGRVDDYIFPIAYFFDSPNHLNAEGRSVRTDRIVKDLQQVIP